MRPNSSSCRHVGAARWIVIGLLFLVAITIVAFLALQRGMQQYRKTGVSMAQRIEMIRERMNPELNYAPKGTLIEARRDALKQIDSFESRMEAVTHLAYMQITDGQTQDAIDQLTAAREQISESSSPEAERLDAIVNELLMVAYLRLAEQINCLQNHTSQSCLFPIEGEGVHIDPTGSRLAIEEMQKILDRNPKNIHCIWLLNLAYMTLDEYPSGVPRKYLIPPHTFASEASVPRFEDIAMRIGLEVSGLAGGVAVDDFDNDGDLDLIVSAWGLHEQLRSFINNGDGTFSENSEKAGLTGQTGGLNLVHADYDNDGWVDVLVLRGAWQGQDGEHPNSLLRNVGDGTFRDVTEDAGVLSFHPTQTAAWGDFDNDGWLDLFIGNESFRDDRYPCEMYRNNGDGTFTDVAEQVGLDHTGFVKAAVWGDYDNDGRIDLFLSCFQESNALYRNDGQQNGAWKFEDVSLLAGVLAPKSSFPAWFFDYDNDGLLDLFVASFSDYWTDNLRHVVADYLKIEQNVEPAALYHNNGDGTFSNVAPRMNIDKILLAMGANFGDIDNDGWLDCYFGTGEPSLMTLIPNRMFRNDRGRRFQDVTTSGGFGHLQKGHGIAFADFDHDGDQDIYAVMGGAYSGDFYQNVFFENPGNNNNWITLRLEGVTSNRSAIGARVQIDMIENDEQRSIYNTVGTGGSFGANSLQQEIGLGSATRISKITINWPTSGVEQVFDDVPMNAVYIVREDAQELKRVEVEVIPLGSAETPHEHHHHHHY